MHESSHRRFEGFAFVELTFATILVVVCASLLIGQLTFNYLRTTETRDKIRGHLVAKSLLAEVQTHAAAGKDIQMLDDGSLAKPSLSLWAPPQGGVDRYSNTRRGGDWVWWRQIRVEPVGEGPSDLRKVTATISKRNLAGVVREIANLSTLVATPAVGYPSTQVLDLYLLAVENIPGRGVEMDSIRPFMEAAVTELEQANPGLELRTHWITKASYGRDAQYAPEVAGFDSGKIYRYPGRTSDTERYSYEPDLIGGRIHHDGRLRNDGDRNRHASPYALADGRNHGMRLPEERAFHDRRVAAVRERRRAISVARDLGVTPPNELADMSEEPTLRLLLEDLNSDPERFRSALILNVHGDVLPMPALRNYADAAKDPGNLPGLRCVTHPEELRTHRDPTGSAHDSVALRVYSYVQDRVAYDGARICPPDHAIALRVFGLDLTDPDRAGCLRPEVELQNLYGGVPLVIDPEDKTKRTIDDDYRPFTRAKDLYQPKGEGEMFYVAQFIDPGFGEEKYTLVWLFNTPVVSPTIKNSGKWVRTTWVDHLPGDVSMPTEPMRRVPDVPADAFGLVTEQDDAVGQVQGLPEDARLYDLEYYPAPTGPRRDFSEDLASVGSGPKNTARWRLEIPGSVFADRLFVDPSGRRSEPVDVRLRVVTSFWKVGDSVPASGPNTSVTHAWWAADREAVPITERSQFLGDPRHNPYKDLTVGDPDFGDRYNRFFGSLPWADATAAGLDPERLDAGWLGGRGIDVPRYLELLREGLLRTGAVFGTLGTWREARVLVGGEVDDAADVVVRKVDRRSSWRSVPWLGELYPDSHAVSDWADLGNLRPGVGQHALAYAPPRQWRLRAASWNWQSFFNAVSGEQVLGVAGANRPSRLTVAGQHLATTYRSTLPDRVPLAAELYWEDIASVPEWADYRSTRVRGEVLQAFTQVGSTPGASVVELSRSGARARVAVVGLDTDDLALRTRFALLSLVHGSLTGRVRPLPRVVLEPEFEYGTDSARVRIRWDTTSTRWDGRVPANGAPGLDESQLTYALSYSRDGGRTWHSAVDGSRVLPGERPAEHLGLADRGPGTEEFEMALPADRSGAGAITLRVEVYRAGQDAHCAAHQRPLEIRR